MKTYYRFFGGFLDTQENWLNHMASQGCCLVRTGTLAYEFEPCSPGAFQYCIAFVAHQPYKKVQDYRRFLEELGYRVLHKNANLNCSIGKIRWRPYGHGAGQIATNPGSYNRELLIVEKKQDGLPFALHTTNEDNAAYYRPLRNAFLSLALLPPVLSACLLAAKQLTVVEAALLLLPGLLLLLPALGYQRRVHQYSGKAVTEE